MYRGKLIQILQILDDRICDVYNAARKAAFETPACAERIDGVLDAAGAVRVLRREVEDEVKRSVVGLEIFSHGGARILGHVEILACVVSRDEPRNRLTVLVRRDERHDPYVTANVYIHDLTGRDVTSWDCGHYFDSETEAREDFAKRAGL